MAPPDWRSRSTVIGELDYARSNVEHPRRRNSGAIIVPCPTCVGT